MTTIFKNIKRLFMMGTMFLLLTACIEDITDLNENPNNPTEVPANFLLPSAQVQGTYYMGGELNRATSFWIQHWATTGGQYQRLDRYDVTDATFNTAWGQLYAGAINDLQIIIDESPELPNYRAQARIMKAYYFQMVADLWGDVPYSEALKGVEGNITPGYDDQMAIYTDLIEELDLAISEIDEEGAVIASEDLLAGGDMLLWEKFANSIKLRVYMRLSEIDEATAQEGVSEIFTGNAPLLEAGENIELVFGSRLETNANPLFQQEFNRSTDYGVSETFVSLLNDLNDPRIATFLRPNVNGNYSGVPNGNPNDLPTDGTGAIIVSRIGSTFVQETSPVPLMTHYDVKFIEAEAAIRGWVNQANAEQLYNEAVTAVFDYYGVNVGNYLDAGQPAEYDGANAFDQLMTQRYISLFARGVEAYNEWRRTGIPDITPAINNISGGQIPLRFPYVNAELTNNPGNAPAVNIFNDPVKWDVN
ncbi:SusD/RagB family nutrient-binding outer membrane lipoprotein [Marivirga sp. S37H4]|uniref:SusD/RagB family nutrient-binding outer membrane lipoprotein n=1 Tax=Marivirga aurantiaca TaxID=2802615 RepID=A0A934WYP4_9BACT|nr:SusD/RagB family nutrient-binding outer membrane lipoprotein [Marivirga aurantiaca]MBK6265231.1 SusD/RagB family nutrient-binding outer membrane lipoprotein [Marivirga aurantiaca]